MYRAFLRKHVTTQAGKERNHTKSLISVVILISIFVFFTPLYQHTSEAWASLNRFIDSQGSYQQLKLSDKVVASALEVKQILPQGAVVQISPYDWVLDRVKARYVLAPEIIVAEEGWSYFINFEELDVSFTGQWEERKLSTGVSVYALPGSLFSINKGAQDPPSENLFLEVIAFGVNILAQLLVGFLILLIMGIRLNDFRKIWIASTSYLLGFVTLTSCLWICLLFGLQMTTMNLIIIFGGSTIFLGIFAFIKLRKFDQEIKVSKGIPSNRTPPHIFEYCFIGLSCLLFIIIIVRTILTPVFFGDWDSMSHWIIKSKIFYYDQGLDFNFTHNNQYPILWPLNVAMQFTLMGGAFDEVAKWASAILFTAFLMQLWGCFQILNIHRKWRWFGIALFLVGFTINSITRAYPENAFLAFLAGTLSGILAWGKGPSRKGYLLLSAFMALGLSLTKLEGWPTVFILFLALVISYQKQLRDIYTLVPIGLMVLPGILANFGWYAWLQKAGYVADTSHFGAILSLSKIVIIVKGVIRDVQRKFHYALVAGVGGFSILGSNKNWNSEEIFLLILTIGLSIFVVVGVLGWDSERIAQYSYNATDRLILHVAPPLILLIVSRARKVVPNFLGD